MANPAWGPTQLSAPSFLVIGVFDCGRMKIKIFSSRMLKGRRVGKNAWESYFHFGLEEGLLNVNFHLHEHRTSQIFAMERESVVEMLDTDEEW
jgi:hypothetical protein